MKFIDFFSGVGGFTKGLELAGHECIGHCEFDEFAEASYRSMHTITEEQRTRLSELDKKKRQKEILKSEYLNGEWYARDVRAVNSTNIPRVDCWTFGAPAKISALPGEEQDLTEKEVALYEKFLESWKSSKKKINPHGLSTKTLRECFLATEDLISYQSSLKWTDSGTISSGKISTQDGSFRKIGSAYTLLDVIEEEVNDKYFLSREMAEKIVQGN